MDRNNCFPLFFAVQRDGWYKVYQNNVYQCFDSLGFPANVLWPVDGVELGYISEIKPSKDGHPTFIRKWNGHTYRSCVWYYTNNQVDLFIDGEMKQIPVIKIDCDDDALPFNNAELKPKGRKTKPIPIAPRFPVSSSMPVGRGHSAT